MFCPSCGAHQSGDKKFCTLCGQNLFLVSQALGGRVDALQAPGRKPSNDPDRERQLAKGVKLTIIGGAFLAIQFFSFIFSLPFRNGGSPFGFFSFIALVLMAVGISKLVSAKQLFAREQPRFQAASMPSFTSKPPQPYIAETPVHLDAPVTGDLAEQLHPGPSVTEDETQQLQEYAPPRNQA